MKPRIKIGLIAGVIGLVLNICVSGFIGFCGPFASLLAGGIAGYFAASQEKLPTKKEGATAGAIAGAITGGLMIIGQIIGGMIALTIQQNTGTVPFIGTPDSDMATQLTFYLSGAATGFCFGAFGTLLAAGVGAGAGYFGTVEQTSLEVPPAQ